MAFSVSTDADHFYSRTQQENKEKRSFLPASYFKQVSRSEEKMISSNGRLSSNPSSNMEATVMSHFPITNVSWMCRSVKKQQDMSVERMRGCEQC